jgi:hypothetical protein
MKITFLCEHENAETITMEKYSPADSDELYEMFERFVHACGLDASKPEQETNMEINIDVGTEKSKSWLWTVEQLKDERKNRWDWEKSDIEHLEAPVSDFRSTEYCTLCGLKTEIMEREKCYDTYCPKNLYADKR